MANRPKPFLSPRILGKDGLTSLATVTEWSHSLGGLTSGRRREPANGLVLVPEPPFATLVTEPKVKGGLLFPIVKPGFRGELHALCD